MIGKVVLRSLKIWSSKVRLRSKLCISAVYFAMCHLRKAKAYMRCNKWFLLTQVCLHNCYMLQRPGSVLHRMTKACCTHDCFDCQVFVMTCMQVLCQICMLTHLSLSLCQKAGQWQRAIQNFRRMEAADVKVDVVASNSAIAACAKGSDCEQAWAVFSSKHLL